jgi:hypothetical protein
MKKYFARYDYSHLFFFPKQERSFLLFIVLAFVLSMFAVRVPGMAMWLGFIFAAYAAIANDSIQTIGTFIASNQDKKWWILWIFLGGIFIATVTYSFLTVDVVGGFNEAGEAIGDGIVDGDVSNGRLAAKGFENAPTEFHFLQVAAPIFLLILTRLRMPVSTTFILLTSFAASPAAVGKVLSKSFSGYILALVIGFVAFLLVARLTQRMFKGKAHPGWTVAQWLISGTLWSVWLMQDAANIAVYLPRSMGGWEFFAFTGVIFVGLGLLLYYKGGRIQTIVTEKSTLTDVRFATIIDFIYCIILFYFKLHSKVPMSTTWVFIGLLGGRELAMALRRTANNSVKKSAGLMIKDFSFALFGLFISIAIAVGVNDQLSFSSMVNDMPGQFVDGIAKFFSRLFGG